MAVIDRDKQRQRELIEEGKVKFEAWLDKCEDMQIRMYIDNLMKREKCMSDAVDMYRDFFERMSSLLPKKHVEPLRF